MSAHQVLEQAFKTGFIVGSRATRKGGTDDFAVLLAGMMDDLVNEDTVALDDLREANDLAQGTPAEEVVASMYDLYGYIGDDGSGGVFFDTQSFPDAKQYTDRLDQALEAMGYDSNGRR